MRRRQLVTIGALTTLLSVTGIGGSSSLAQPVQAQVGFHVPTMSCAGCEYRVEGSIWQAPGILAVAFDAQDVWITYDPSVVTPEAIEAAIEVIGDVAEPLGA